MMYFGEKKVAVIDAFEKEDAFDLRETANGDTILDGSHAIVKQISGKTAFCENLIPYPYLMVHGGSYNGIARTILSDGSVMLNGTASADVVNHYIASNTLSLPAGTYFFSGCPSGGSTTTYYTQVEYLLNGVYKYHIEKGSGVTFTVDDEISSVRVMIWVRNGVTVENLVFKCMLYQKRNLLPYPYQYNTSRTINGVTFTIEDDGAITLNGYATAQAAFYLMSYCSLLARTYTISSPSLNNNVYLQLQRRLTSGAVVPTYIKGNKVSYTVTDESVEAGDVYNLVLVVKAGTYCSGTKIYPMLNKGNNPLPYQPYYLPYQPPLKAIKGTHENLIPFPYYFGQTHTHNGVTYTRNDDGSVSVKGTATGGLSYCLLTTSLIGIAGETYTVSGGKDGCIVTFRPSNGSVNFLNSKDGKGATGVMGEYTNKKCQSGINVSEGTTVDTVIYPMLNYGDTALPYRPFRHRNLLTYPYIFTDATKNGVTFTKNGNGSISFQGTATAQTYVGLGRFYPGDLVVGTKYYLSGSGKNVTICVDAYKDGSWLKTIRVGNGKFAVDWNGYDYVYVYYVFQSGAAIDETVSPMVKEVELGCVHSRFKAIKSTGKNLFNEPEFAKLNDVSIDTYDGEQCYKIVPTKSNHKVPFVGKTGDILSYSFEVCAPNGASMSVFLDSMWAQNISFESGETAYKKFTKTVTLNRDCSCIDFRLYNIPKYNLYYFKNIMFNFFSTAQPYEPYKAPDEYTDSNSYELAEYDYINPQTGELVTQTRTIVFDGTEEWAFTGANEYGLSDFRYGIYPLNAVYNVIVCPSYPTKDILHTASKEENIYCSGGVIAIRSSQYSTLEDWKAHLAELYANGTPLVVEYKLVTPTITPLTDYPKEYTAYNGGSEDVWQDEENSIYGAKPKVKIEYERICKLEV